MTPLEQFLTIASDLYATNPDYRAEVEAERDNTPPPTERPISNRDRLDELEWLITNGTPVTTAITQVGSTREALERAAWRAGRRNLAIRIFDTTETNMTGGISSRWARQWSAGHHERRTA